MDKVIDLKVSEKEMKPLRKKATKPIKKTTLKEAPKHKLDSWSVMSVFVFILFAFVCVLLAKEFL